MRFKKLTGFAVQILVQFSRSHILTSTPFLNYKRDILPYQTNIYQLSMKMPYNQMQTKQSLEQTHRTIQHKHTHPPYTAQFSLPSTSEHEILPEAHTLQAFEEPESAEESVISTVLILAFPFVVHVSKVHDLITINIQKSTMLCNQKN